MVLNYRESNKAKDLLNTFNDFYVGTYYRLYTVWKSGHKTIADTGYVMKGNFSDQDIGTFNIIISLINPFYHINLSQNSGFI